MRRRSWLSGLQLGAVARPAARLSRVVLDTRPAPAGTDLRWRPGLFSHPFSPPVMIDPENGQRLGDDGALWHDGREGELLLRQSPNDADQMAPFGLRLEIEGFTGSYLSLSIDLPPEVLHDLLQAHILRLETALRLENPLHVYARLNVRHGPNTDEILRDLPITEAAQPGRQVVEFDMAVTDINEKRLEKIWLDLIFENPRRNAIEITELILSRHLRAGF